MAGPGKTKAERDAAASFFGDDDLDWFDDDEAPADPTPEPPGPSASADATPAPPDVPADPPPAAGAPDSGVVADPPAPLALAAPPPLGAPPPAIPEAAPRAAQGAPPRLRPPVAPPPPPRFVAPGGAPVAGGYLDSILPRTLAPPRVAATPPPVGAGPEVVDAIGVEPAPVTGWAVPQGAEAWREAVGVLEHEAEHHPERRGELLLQAAWVRLRHLGDRQGARERLEQARAVGATPDPVLDCLAAEGTPAALAAWTARARGSEEAAAADAWRRVADLAGHDRAAREALEAALAADPDDVAAAERLLDHLRVAGDDDAFERVAAALAERVDPTTAAALQVDRGRALARLGRVEAAVAAWRDALALDPHHGGALAGLEAVLPTHDPGALGELLVARAEQEPGSVALLLSRAAEAFRRAGREDDAASAAADAIAAGSNLAAIAWEADRIRAADGEALLQAALDRPDDDPARPAAIFRAAVVLERADAPAPRVVEAYRAALQAGFAPAADPLERALEAAGDLDALVEVLEARLATWSVPPPADALRLAEVLEARRPDDPEALAGYLAAGREVAAARGVARVAAARGEAAARVEALEVLAELEPDADVRAARALEAARMRLDAGDPSRAAALAERALQGDAGAVLALELQVEALVAQGDALGAADRLEDRAAGLEPAAAAPCLIRAARLRAPSDPAGALAALDAVLAVAPDHPEATACLARLAGRLRPEVQQARWRSGGGGDGRVAAATWDALGGGEVADDVTGPAADALRLLSALLSGEPARLTAALERAADPDGELLVARIEHLAGTTPEAAIAALEQVEEPTPGVGGVLARLAERLGRPDLAVRLARGASSPRELRRLQVAAAPHASAALDALRDVLDDDDTTAGELALVARLAALAAEPGLRRAAHAAVVARSSSAAERAAHAARCGALAFAAGDAEAAVEAWLEALAARPGSTDAFEGAEAALIASGDAAGLQALFDAHAPDDARGRAEALTGVDPAAAVPAWREASAQGELLDHLGLELALADAEAWRELFEAWTARRAATRTPEEQDRLERKRRWVLAEKLADTDDAWELYQQLHEEHPDDREVRENLARICGVRGDVEAAVTHLRHLVTTAGEPREAARYQRRVAEVYLAAGDDTAARQALLDGLDHAPEDVESLSMLRAIAERTEDWETLHTVLRREAGLVPHGTRAALLRELAAVAEERLGDPQRATDGWRAVLAEVPGDPQALRRLLHLADAQGDDGLFLEVGRDLAGVEQGAERSALLRRLGERCQALGRHHDAVHHLEQAVSAEVPDLEAARLLERVHVGEGDYPGVVRTLLVQADLLDGQARTDVLLRAARVELDARHDREAAHRVYERVLRHDPTQADALRFSATYLYEAGRHAEALEAHARLEPVMADEDDLDDYDVHLEVTNFYFRFADLLRVDGRVDEARARYERVLQLNAAHLPTLEAIGPLLIDAGEWERAGEIYQQLLQLTGGQGDPEQVAQTFTMLGRVELHHERVDRAHKRFHRALDALPSFVPALKGLAAVHERRQDWQALLTAYNNVIYNATVPQDVVDAYMTKGRVLDDELERPDKAAQHYERSLSVEGARPEGYLLSYLRLTELALRRKAWEEATDYALRGLAFAPEAPPLAAELHLGLALARYLLDDHEGAGEALERALSLNPVIGESLADDPLADADLVVRGIRARLPR